MRPYSDINTKKWNKFSFLMALVAVLLSLLLAACDLTPGVNANNNGVNNGNNSPSNNCNGVNDCNTNYGNSNLGNSSSSNTSQSSTVSSQPVGTTPITSDGSGCFGGNNYQLPSTLSGNVYFRVEFYFPGGPEYESWLSPGTWNVTPGVNGWVWEFPTSCTSDELMADAIASHNRRVANGANNAGALAPSDSRVTSAFTQE